MNGTDRYSACADVDGIRLHYVRMGEGPLVMFVHGFPATSYHWRMVMPHLAERYTVIAPDMRGYGLSDKPLTGYDKRTMGRDLRVLAEVLGFESIALIVGHDRGARVAQRCALDAQDYIERIALLDLIPSREALRTLDFNGAKRYWHWFFHLVPDLPEAMLSSEAVLEAYIHYFFKNAYIREHIDESVKVYVHSLMRQGALRAALEDYRMTFSKDIEDDDATIAAGIKLRMPTLLLWGAKGLNTDRDKMLDVWSHYADNVEAVAVEECGYYMAEEQPAALAQHLLDFLESTSKGKIANLSTPGMGGFTWSPPR